MIIIVKIFFTKLDTLGSKSEACAFFEEDVLVLGIPEAGQCVRQHICLCWNPLRDPNELVFDLFQRHKSGHLEADFVAGTPIGEQVKVNLVVSLSQDGPKTWQLIM